MTEITFKDLALSPAILKAIEEIGYVKPSPIQAEAIPVVLSGKDIIGQAQTGTGKLLHSCYQSLRKSILRIATFKH